MNLQMMNTDSKLEIVLKLFPEKIINLQSEKVRNKTINEYFTLVNSSNKLFASLVGMIVTHNTTPIIAPYLSFDNPCTFGWELYLSIDLPMSPFYEVIDFTKSRIKQPSLKDRIISQLDNDVHAEKKILYRR